MNQQSCIGFGTDANVLAAYANRANERLGSFSFLIENTGNNALYLQFKEWDGTTSPSGWSPIGTPVTVAARGQVTKNFTLNSKKVGFFGSGNTTANISTVIRNPADLRGAQIDINATGRRGWGFDDGFDTKQMVAGYGQAPDGTAADKAIGE